MTHSSRPSAVWMSPRTRRLGWVLSLCLVAGLTSGCGESPRTAFKIVQDKVTANDYRGVAARMTVDSKILYVGLSGFLGTVGRLTGDSNLVPLATAMERHGWKGPNDGFASLASTLATPPATNDAKQQVAHQMFAALAPLVKQQIRDLDACFAEIFPLFETAIKSPLFPPETRAMTETLRRGKVTAIENNGKTAKVLTDASPMYVDFRKVGKNWLVDVSVPDSMRAGDTWAPSGNSGTQMAGGPGGPAGMPGMGQPGGHGMPGGPMGPGGAPMGPGGAPMGPPAGFGQPGAGPPGAAGVPGMTPEQMAQMQRSGPPGHAMGGPPGGVAGPGMSPEQMAQMQKGGPPGPAMGGLPGGAPGPGMSPEQMAQMQKGGPPGHAMGGAPGGAGMKPEEMAGGAGGAPGHSMPGGGPGGAGMKPEQMAGGAGAPGHSMPGGGPDGAAGNAGFGPNGAMPGGPGGGPRNAAALLGQAPPENIPEYAVFQLLKLILEDSTTGLDRYIGSKATGLLADLRDGQVDAEKLQEFKDKLKGIKPQGTKAAGSGKVITLVNEDKLQLQFTVAKEDGDFKVKELQIKDASKKKKK